jgi:hypothetical protein
MYKFIYEDDDETGEYPQYPTYIQMDFKGTQTWDDLTQGFLQFLKAAGYCFPVSAAITIFDEDTGEDLNFRTRAFKNHFLNEETEDEDTTS